MSIKSELEAEKEFNYNQIRLPISEYLVAIICGAETMTGFLLCGFAKTSEERSNFLIVDISEDLSRFN